MADRAKETSFVRTGKPGARGALVAEAAPLALFCAVMGVLAVGVGALAALLVPGSAARGLVWLTVTVLVATGAGLWWGLTPVTERLRVLSRVLAGADPRREPHR